MTVDFVDTINAIAIMSFFKKLRRHYKHAKKIYLICDNAGYNKAKEVREAAKALGVVLIYLPPYSPNLNLIERLWKFFKKNILYNRYYEKFDAFKFACEDFFKHIARIIYPVLYRLNPNQNGIKIINNNLRKTDNAVPSRICWEYWNMEDNCSDLE